MIRIGFATESVSCVSKREIGKRLRMEKILGVTLNSYAGDGYRP
jgi:hypothetical protein